MQYSVIIVGGGPAGLACATALAQENIKVLVIERKPKFGPKVCAGGITWSGLIKKLPESLIECRFPTQIIKTRLQTGLVKEKDPIIATVNREKLGGYMAEQARTAGADLLNNCVVKSIQKDTIIFDNHASGEKNIIARYEAVVGADGASSIVRRHIGLKTERMGTGINYQIPGKIEQMEWHLDWKLFRNGYGWIFPHKDSVSVGAYADRIAIPAAQLKSGLQTWARQQGHELSGYKPKAELVSYDYRGWNFGNVFLVGEAAGLASGLTGEGIYPAIVSGELVGNYIAKNAFDMEKLKRLIYMHRIHANMVHWTRKNRFLTPALFEFITLLLRAGLLNFKKLEMAH